MIDHATIIEIFKASPVPTFVLKAKAPDFTIIEANDAALEILGRNTDQVIGAPLFQAFPPSSNEIDGNGQQVLVDSFQEIIQTREDHRIENFRYDIPNANGEYEVRYWEIENSPVVDEHGEVAFIVNTFRNITNNIITEREANLMLQNAADSFVLVGRDYKILNYNEAYSNHCSKILGKPAQKGASILDYAVTERREKAKEILEKVLEEGKIINSELSLTTLEGKPVHFKTNYRPAYNEEGNIYGLLFSMYKRTEEVIAKKQLEENEAHFRSLVENGSDILFVLNPDGTPSYVSPSITKTLGYSPQEMKDMEVADVVHPEDVPIIFKELEKCMQRPGEPIKVTPARMRHKNGGYHWFEGTITNMLHDPAIGGIVDNFREITDRVKAEQKIKQAKEQYQSLVQTINGIVWEADAQSFAFHYVSPQVQRILGFSQDEWLQTEKFWQNHIHPDDRERVINYCKRETEQGNNHTFEYRMQHKDGHFVWLRDIVSVNKENGIPSTLSGVLMDISHQKKLEEKLEQAYELSKIGNWELNVQEEQLFWSRYVKEIHEVEPDFKPELDSAINFYKEGWSRKAIREAVEKAINDGTPFDLELNIVTAKGNERWIRAVGRAEFKGDTCIRVFGSTQDITDRKQAELQRKFERINKEALINSTKDIVWSINKDKKLITANKAFKQRINDIQGIKMEAGDSIFNGIPENSDFRKEWNRYYDRALNGELFRKETREIAPEDGSLIWYDTSFNPIYENGKVTGVACYSRNITDTKKAQKQLQKAEQEFRNVVEHSTNLFFQHDVNGDLTYVSPQSYDFFGYKPENAKRNWTDFITEHPINEKGKEHTKKALKTGVAQPPYELQLQKKDGEIIWVKVNEAPILKDGEVIGMVGSLTDITDQKLYEEQLHESLERYDYASKATRDAIYDWDLEEDLLYWGKGFFNQFGHQTEGAQFTIQNWAEMVHPNDVEKTHNDLNKTLKDSSATNWEQEYRIRKADGKYAYVIERGYIIRDANGKAIRMIGALRNITESKLNELKNKLQHEVASFFKQEEKLQTILNDVVKYLADYGNFNTGEIWLTSPDSSHQFLGASYAKDEDAELFYEHSKSIQEFEYGEGLPGTVWKTNAIQVWPDIHTDKAFIRFEAASKSGLKTAIGLPLLHNKNFAGVLLFGSIKTPEDHTNIIEIFEVLQEFLGAEIKRKQQEEELLLLFENAPEIIAIASPHGRFTEVNPTFCKILGYAEEEITSQPFENFLHPDDKIATDKEYEETISGERQAENFVNRYRTKNGDYRWISWYSTPAFREEGYVFAFGRDVTETKELEELLKQTNRLARVGSWEMDLKENESVSVYWSEMTREIMEVPDDYAPTPTDGFEFYEDESKERIQKVVERVIEDGKSFDEELKIKTAKGNKRWIRCIGNAEFQDGACKRIYGSFQDITEKKIAEIELEKAFEARKSILESIGDGFYAVNKDWTVTYWNKEAEHLLETNRKDVINKNLWDMFPEAVEMKLYTEYHRALHEQKNLEFEDFFPPLEKWFEISLYPNQNGLSVYFKDITERKKAREKLRELNRQLQKRADELAASNAELEQFAYVASHDLQEPLRMVTSFLTQLDKKYSDKLDGKAAKYIYYAVDGAQRMRQIILDLLNYSRLNNDNDDFQQQDLNLLVDEVQSLERSNIQENEVEISVGPLPSLPVNPGAIKQLFQNLISNAIKYQQNDVTPKIEIQAEELNKQWKISIKDNGIGINPEFQKSIFQIFQRLHTRDEYSGTGIGLAISKKIVERHGGKIWVESQEGKGSTFYFTLNKKNKETTKTESLPSL